MKAFFRKLFARKPERFDDSYFLEKERAIFADGKTLTFSDLKVGDMVSTKNRVGPYRNFEEIQEIGLMLHWGRPRMAIKVQGLPFAPYELKLDLAWIE